MPKAVSLSSLFNSLSNTPLDQSSTTPDYFLFLLGTDTTFTAIPTPPYYHRGETLSYTAQLVAADLGEACFLEPTTKNSQALTFSTPSVDLINGPTTRGTEVGQRIALAVFLALHAAASGKTTLNIAGHSRGAVEAILVTHELDRIKKALAKYPCLSLYSILTASPCPYTKKAMERMFQDGAEDPALRQRLQQRLSVLKTSAFLIDPVPGGRLFRMPTRWSDPAHRFYQPMPCHQQEVILCRDERSRCFIPVVPRGSHVEVLPGHHGTLSGNAKTQQLVDLPLHLNQRDVTTGQTLTLYKLWHFFRKATEGRFGAHARPELNLRHPELDNLAKTFLGANESHIEQELLKHYQAVQDNNSAFRALQRFAYAGISYFGLEGTYSGHRYVHLHDHNYKNVSDISPTIHPFINIKHALLFLKKETGIHINLTADAATLAMTLESTLTEIINTLNTGHTDSKAHLHQLLTGKKQSRKSLFKSIALLADTLCQHYLYHPLAPDVHNTVIMSLQASFQRIRAALAEDATASTKKPLKELYSLLQKHLKRTVTFQCELTHDKSSPHILNGIKELKILSAIQTKLLPLIDHYRRHLITEVKKHEASPLNKAYTDISNKLEILKKLHHLLTDPTVVKPSHRLMAFATTLKSTDTALLKEHRDSKWKQFVDRALHFLALLATGILPGLAGLLIYAKTTGRSPFFFAKTQGENFINDCLHVHQALRS